MAVVTTLAIRTHAGTQSPRVGTNDERKEWPGVGHSRDLVHVPARWVCLLVNCGPERDPVETPPRSSRQCASKPYISWRNRDLERNRQRDRSAIIPILEHAGLLRVLAAALAQGVVSQIEGI